MTIEELRNAIKDIPPNVEIVGEECFKEHYGLSLACASLGQDNKFVMFFKHKQMG